MNFDPDRDVDQLLIEAARLSQAANDLTGAAAAARARGIDGSGQVEMRVASDGSPDHILVKAGWQRNLEPSQVGAAVLEAAQDAARTATRQWSSNLASSGGLDRAAGLDAHRPSMSAGVADSEKLKDPAFGGLLSSGQVRDVNELAETAIKALQNAAIFSERVIAGLQHPPAGEGIDDSRHVHITVAGGQVTGCRVDEGWAGGRDGPTLGAALTQAAHRAASAVPSLAAPDHGAGDALLADVLATLRYDSDRQAAPGNTGAHGQEQHR